MTIKFYRATCGSVFRVTTRPATTKATLITQAKRSPNSQDFGPDYPTTAAEVARLVSFGSFLPIGSLLSLDQPCP